MLTDNVQKPRFKVGDIVRCPEDRGEASYTGRIVHVSETSGTNIRGTVYYWTTVRRRGGKSQHVWPDHRLS